ncbi:MAG TPA: hypothetical protein VKN73_03175 [Desulfosalsimonadaceae bacterium]|nr:hypothetical protein [Desulfosalsimonadaceae bacterium]
MNRIKMSFIDNDYAVKASTDVATEGEKPGLSSFLEQIHEELVTGGTAFLEIEGLNGKSMTFSIAEAV